MNGLNSKQNKPINSSLWGQELNYAGGEKVKYEIIDLPIIAIIGKEGLCTKEKNVPISVILRILE